MGRIRDRAAQDALRAQGPSARIAAPPAKKSSTKEPTSGHFLLHYGDAIACRADAARARVPGHGGALSRSHGPEQPVTAVHITGAALCATTVWSTSQAVRPRSATSWSPPRSPTR